MSESSGSPNPPAADPSARAGASQSASGYRQVDHTADLALELWAPSEEELLAVGARAIVEILTESADISADAKRIIEIDAVDAEDRLVQWLNEIIVAAVMDGFLATDAVIELGERGPGWLRAELHGKESAGERLMTELKSATYHDLLVESHEEGARARVVIDV